MNKSIFSTTSAILFLCAIFHSIDANAAFDSSIDNTTVVEKIPSDKRSNFSYVYAAVDAGKIPRRDALKGMNISAALLSYAVNNEGMPNDREITNLVFDEISKRAGKSVVHLFYCSWRTAASIIMIITVNTIRY